ncbi:apolipophorins [Cimex lectularius]|uniref:Apolipophorin n=1 Tax=Cimex lectularius TaxID=79782 RepID=A0A8I6SHL6_CIMLE|nr:apolipophorins [Cimex lectularius]
MLCVSWYRCRFKMATYRELLRLAIFIILAVYIIDARECKIGCLGRTNPLYHLEPGKVYQYSFKGNSEHAIAGVKDRVGGMLIEAQVSITVGDKCDHSLKVNNVKITSTKFGNSTAKSFNLDMSRNLKFGLQNGKIDDLCVEEDEKTYTLNIKRAILSLLQSSVVKESGSTVLTENDVYGSCPTVFDFSNVGNTLTVKKTKDLNLCAFRETYVGQMSANRYFSDSDIQSSNVLTGHLKTVQSLSGGVLTQAKSEEVYVYNPSSTSEAPAKTIIKSELVLTGAPKAGNVPQSSAHIGKTLIYEGGHESEYPTKADELNKDINQLSKSDKITQTSASTFNNLLRKLNKASAEQIGKVHDFCNTNEKKKSIFFDALFSCNSAPCVYYTGELMSKGDINENESKIWFSKVGFAKSVHPDALQKLSGLIKESSPISAYLGVGMLAGKYCKHHSCKSDRTIENVENKIGHSLLQKGCKTTIKEVEDKVIASMKGLSNVHYLTDRVTSALIECATNNAHSNRLRAAALDTLKTDAHKAEVKEPVGKLFIDNNQDSELRIKAYLVLAECPCGKVATWVREVLKNRKSLQVGAFVVSHLRNVRASTNPDKAALKHHLGNIMEEKTYPFDFRKFSQNYEFSYMSDLFNMGDIAETNIIYSQHSFIPRTLSLNLTSQLFGQSFNWLEIDARFENVEKALERAFGPKGFFNTKSSDEVVEESKIITSNYLEKIVEKAERSFRPKRSPKSNLNYDMDVDIDLNLKTGGSQIHWTKYHSADEKWNSDNLINSVFGGIEKIVDKAKNTETSYRKYVSLGNFEMQYGTGLGLPMVLRMNAAAGVNLMVDSNIDLPAIVRHPENADIRFQLIPSAAIDLVGSMTIDGINVESGVQLHSVAHTSTGSYVSFRLLEGTGVDVKFGLPVDKQEILNFKTKFQLVYNNYEVYDNLEYNSKREKYEGCFDQLVPLVGLVFCVSSPWETHRTLSPAYGPINFKFLVTKDEPLLEYYHFRVKYTKGESGIRRFEALFDTPRTKFSRKMAIDIEGSLHAKKFLKAKFNSPWSNALFDGSIKSTSSENMLSAKLNIDETDYFINAGATKTKSGNVVKYVPVFEYKAPELRTSMVGRRGGHKPAKQAYKVTGTVLVEDTGSEKKITVNNVCLHTPRTKYTLEGNGKYGKQYQLVEGNYKLSWDKEHLEVKGYYKRPKGNENLSLWLAVLPPTQFQDFGVDLKYDLKRQGNLKTKGNYDAKFFLTHGSDPNNEMTKLAISSSMDVEKDKKFKMENKISYPLLNLEAHQAFGLTLEKSSLESLTASIKGKFDKYSGQLKMSSYVTDHHGYNVILLAEAMGNSIKIDAVRNVLSPEQTKYTNTFEVKPGGKYELNFLVTRKTEKGVVDLNVNAEVKLPAEPKLLEIEVVFKSKEKHLASSLKASADSKEYVNLNFIYNTGEKLNLQFKLLDLVDGHLDSNIIDQEQKSKSKLNIHFPRIDKKAEGNAEFTDYFDTGSIDFCWDTKDPLKKIKLEYNNEYSFEPTTDIMLRSSLTYGSRTTKLNMDYKGDITENIPITRKITVILPEGDEYTFNVEGYYEEKGDNINTKFTTTVTCTHPDGKALLFNPFEKMSLTVGLEPFNEEDDVYKGLVDFNLINNKKENLDTSCKFDIREENNKWLIKTEGSVKGNLMKGKDLSVIFNAEVPEEDESQPLLFSWSLDHADDTHLEGNCKVTEDSVSGEFSGKLPQHNEVKSFKWTTDNSFVWGETSNTVKLNNNFAWNENKFLKHVWDFSHSDSEATFFGEFHTTEAHRKLNAKAHWTCDDVEKFDASGSFSWTEGKSADFSVEMEKSKDNKAGLIHVNGHLPEFGKVDLILKNKFLSEKNGAHSSFSITIKDTTVAASSVVELLPGHPLIDINVDHTTGKWRFYVKHNSKGERHWSGETKMKWAYNRGGSIGANYDANFQSIDSFYLKGNVDAHELFFKNFHVDIHNENERGNEKQILFVVKKDGTTYSGVINYNVKQEGDNLGIEGSGSLIEDGKNYPLSFKLNVNDRLENLETQFTLSIGKNKWSSKYVNNDKKFYADLEHCHEETECTSSLIEYKLESKSNQRVAKELRIVFDPSIYLESPTVLSYHSKLLLDTYLPVEHMIEFRWSKTGSIKYEAEIKNKGAVMLLHTPKRIVGFESKLDSSKDAKKVEVFLYLNKLTDDKISFLSSASIAKGKDSNTYSSETKLSHKSLGKDYVIKGEVTVSPTLEKLKGKIIVDVFKNPNSQLVLTLKFDHGLKDGRYTKHRSAYVKFDSCKINAAYEQKLVVNFKDPQFLWTETASSTDGKGTKREAGVKIEINRKKIYSHVKIDGSTVFEVDGKISNKEKTTTVAGTTTLLNKKYKNNLEINTDANSLKYNLHFDGKTIEADVSAKMGKKGLFKVSFDKKSCAHFEVALDEPNFLTSTYNYNTDDVKRLFFALADSLYEARNEGTKLVKELVETDTNEAQHTLKCIEDNMPSFSTFNSHVKKELKELIDEFLEEEYIRELSGTIKEHYKEAFANINEMIKKLGEFYDSVGSSAIQLSEKIGKLCEELYKKLLESTERLTTVVLDFMEESVKFSKKIVDKIFEELKKNENDIKEYIKVLTDLVHEFGKQFSKVIFSIHEELENFIEITVQQLKDIPFVEVINEKMQELKDYNFNIPEEFWGFFAEIKDEIKGLMPTTECEKLVDLTADYITKILKQEKFNVQDAAAKLLQQFTKAFSSVVAEVYQHIPIGEKLKDKSLYSRLPFGNLLKGSKGGLRVSLMEWLSSEDLPTLYDLLSMYRPSVIPLQNIPPFDSIGVILHGSDVVTFDGRHIKFKGFCNYKLVEDGRDKNFSVIAHISSGKLEGLTLHDAFDSITIKQGLATVNKQKSEYPTRAGQLSAWIRPYSYGMFSKAGVLIICSRDFNYCEVNVNGFYFDRTVGLLGNMNYEPYDDSKLDSSMVASDDLTFINAMKLGSCPDVPTATYKHPPTSQCTKVFEELYFASIWAPPKPFKEACDSAVNSASDDETKLDAACEIAKGFVRVARNRGSLVTLPEICTYCTINKQKLKYDEAEEVKINKNQADVLFIVESSADNKEVAESNLHKLVPEIKKYFDAQGCTDVRFSVVSFAPDEKYPHYHTSNGNFYGTNVKIQYSEKLNETKNNFVDSLKYHFGLTSRGYVYKDVMDHQNFRPTARKIIIGIHSTPCIPQSITYFIGSLYGMVFADAFGLEYHVITPVEDLSKFKVPVEEIIGFTWGKVLKKNGETVKTATILTNDNCINIANANEGYAFVARKEGDTVSQMAKVITAPRKTDELECECELFDGVISRPVCYVEYDLF